MTKFWKWTPILFAAVSMVMVVPSYASHSKASHHKATSHHQTKKHHTPAPEAAPQTGPEDVK